MTVEKLRKEEFSFCEATNMIGPEVFCFAAVSRYILYICNKYGRVAQADLSNKQLRFALRLVREGKLQRALFDKKKDGTRISEHIYYFIPGDKRFLDGFCGKI